MRRNGIEGAQIHARWRRGAPEHNGNFSTTGNRTAAFTRNRPKAVEHPPSRLKPAWQKYGTPLIVLLLAIAIIVTITRNWNGWEGGRRRAGHQRRVRSWRSHAAQHQRFRVWFAR